ncbi:MAG: ABC transporter ATP-binding protein [Clostridia bacterium]
MANIIQVNNISKSYGKKVVLDDVSFSIEEGQIVGLLGPNGCGKTTLMKILTGLIKNCEGEVRIDDEEISRYTKDITAFLPDKSYLSPAIKAKEAIKMMDTFYDDFDARKARDMANRFHLDLDQKISTMSKGQQEKLNLILVLSREAKLYILDEPLGGLDPASRSMVLDLIMTNYKKDSTVMISTHLINDVERVFDRVLMIKDGELVVNAHVNDIRQHGTSVEEMFKEKFSDVW